MRSKATLAGLLQGFFTGRLIGQRRRQPPHRRQLPRHVPPAPEIRPAAPEDGAIEARPR